MTQSPPLVAAAADHESAAAPQPSRGPALVAASVFVAGLACVVAVILLATVLPQRPDVIVPDSVWPYVAFVVGAMLGEIIYVPVRHGDTFEDQTFFEIVLVVGVLLFAPVPALLGALAGLVLSEALFFRSAVKVVFNLGAYAIASSVLVVVYHLLDGTAERLSLRSVAALLIAALAWEMINLLLLGWVLHVVEDMSLRELLRDQFRLSVLMAVTAVGVAMSLVALWPINPVLALFALLPAVALWYAFRSNGARIEAQDRARSIAAYSAVLTGRHPHSLGERAVPLLRTVFGADCVRLHLPAQTWVADPDHEDAVHRAPDPIDAVLLGALPRDEDEVVMLGREALPAGWTRGYAVAVATRAGAGVLALGAIGPPRGIERILPWSRGGRDQWRLELDQRPVLASLAGSLASALRAEASMTALREETAKLTAVVDHATDGIAGFDDRGRVVLWSPAMTRITGIGEAAALDHNAAVGEPDAADNWSPITVLADLTRVAQAAGDGADVTAEIQRPDGEGREVEVAVVRLPGDDSLAVLTVRDVTRQKRLERMKSDFIATAAHELRTPITPIKGYAQLLASARGERMTHDKRVRALQMIEERANHLSRLVDDLMLATRVSDADKVFEVTDLEDLDLATLVQRALAGKTEIEDRLDVSGTPATVHGNAQRTLQCLDNLISNATKYSAPGTPIRVEFGVAEGTGGPGAAAPATGQVTVIDQGRGIPADEVDKVFEKFYRVEDPLTMTTGGQGLGLFLSREFARAMGGDIRVQSVLGEGSRFTLSLPLAQEDS